jgi:hypothetical protein
VYGPERSDGTPPIICLPFGVVYGVRLIDTVEYRYVGQTINKAEVRFKGHRKVALAGRKTPFYDWLRKFDPAEVQVDMLQEIYTSLEDLGDAEIFWIAGLREDGHRLLNLTDGGLGPTGYVQSAEQRAAHVLRMTGTKIKPRYGVDNPFTGKTHSDEQKAKWSRQRAGSITGDKNPNFGKFGADHPSFGRVMSDESKAKLSAQRTGALNPNFGKSSSAETRAKLSAATKGIPMPSSVRSAHTRHHTNKGKVKDSCRHCADDAAA